MFDPSSIPWWAWLSAGLLGGAGFITALPNRVSEPLTNNDNLGYWMMVISAAIVVGFVLVPLLPSLFAALVVLWSGASLTMGIALLIGGGLFVLGVLWLVAKFLIRRHRPAQRRNP